MWRQAQFWVSKLIANRPTSTFHFSSFLHCNDDAHFILEAAFHAQEIASLVDTLNSKVLTPHSWDIGKLFRVQIGTLGNCVLPHPPFVKPTKGRQTLTCSSSSCTFWCARKRLIDCIFHGDKSWMDRRWLVGWTWSVVWILSWISNGWIKFRIHHQVNKTGLG